MRRVNQMYKAIKENKIIAVNDSGKFPCLIFDEIMEDSEHEVTDYVMVGSEFVLSDDEKAIELKKEQVREVREQYFADYVDWYQSKPLLWEEITEEEKADVAGYRQYLKDYTSGESWWEQNPMDFETWKGE